MKGRLARRLAYFGLAALYLLHNDLWLWDDPRSFLGLPIGLLYHIIFCLAASVVMILLVATSWPADLEVNEREEDRR